MTDTPTRDEVRQIVSDKLEATEARIDAALERISGKVEHLPTTKEMYAAIVGSFIATVAVLIAVLAFGNQTFTSGAAITANIAETRNVADQNAKQIQEIVRQQQLQQQMLSLLIARQTPPSKP